MAVEQPAALECDRNNLRCPQCRKPLYGLKLFGSSGGSGQLTRCGRGDCKSYVLILRDGDFAVTIGLGITEYKALLMFDDIEEVRAFVGMVPRGREKGEPRLLLPASAAPTTAEEAA
jgi:hypothetical protein